MDIPDPTQVNLDDFISNAPIFIRTAPMTVFFFENDEVISSFEAPAGFQLENYVYQLYPNESLSISFPKKNGQKTFRVDFGNKAYVGFYKE